MKNAPRHAIASIAVLLGTALIVTVYMSLERPASDVTSAAFALKNASSAVPAADPSAELVSAMDELAQADEALALFEVSDSRRRMPDVAEALRKADLALDAAYEVRRLDRLGIENPTLEEAPAVAEAISAIPALASVLAASGAGTVDLGDPQVLAALQSAAIDQLAIVQQTIEPNR